MDAIAFLIKGFKRSILASIVLSNVIEPSFDFIIIPPRQSIVSDDNSAPENLDNADCTTSLSLAFVKTVTSVVPKILVDHLTKS